LQAHADLAHYDPSVATAAAKIATRAGTLRRAAPATAVSLVAALARLRHADEPLLLEFSKRLPEFAPLLTPDRLVQALWAPLHLSHKSAKFEAAVEAVQQQLAQHVEKLLPCDAARALWCFALLEGGDAPASSGTGTGSGSEGDRAAGSSGLVRRLFAQAAAGRAGDFGFDELCLLHQAQRLLSDEWLSLPQQPDAAAAAAAAAVEEGGDDEEEQEDEQSYEAAAAAAAAAASTAADDSTLSSAPTTRRPGLSIIDTSHTPIRTDPLSSNLALPPRLARAAAAAARHHAATHAARNRRQQQHVADLLEDMGLAPVRAMPLDGGALVVDVAAICGDLKVAAMCDNQGRRTRSRPHERSGYWVAHGWLLERAGWRVVQLPWYEWELVAEGGGDALAALAHLHNSFAAQGVPL